MRPRLVERWAPSQTTPTPVCCFSVRERGRRRPRLPTTRWKTRSSRTARAAPMQARRASSQ
eukprot:scaffold139490_cov316-Phaeocystis_antarctica.AAC.1